MQANLAAVCPAPEAVRDAIAGALGDKARRIDLKHGEVTVIVTPANYLEAALLLRDHPACRFEQLLDVCGVDYSEYKMGDWDGPRYAVVSHLLSVSLNQRVRLRVFCADDELPEVPTLVDLWTSAN